MLNLSCCTLNNCGNWIVHKELNSSIIIMWSLSINVLGYTVEMKFGMYLFSIGGLIR
jgi:hypothetical protein